MRPSRPYTYLGTVQGMCRQCRQIVPARVLEEGGAVFQERLCPTCGTDTKGAKFCPECGTKIEAQPAGKCPACGADAKGAKFCPECGTKLI